MRDTQKNQPCAYTYNLKPVHLSKPIKNIQLTSYSSSKQSLLALWKYLEFELYPTIESCIVTEGQPCDKFYIILYGKCRVSVKVKHEESNEIVPTTVNYLSTGDCFGEVALMRKRQRNASVITMEPTEVLSMTRAQVSVATTTAS